MSESLSEKELAEELAEELFSPQPRSVAEALEEAEAPVPEAEAPTEDEELAEVEDEAIQPPHPEPQEPVATEPVEEEEPAEVEEDADPNIAWAKRKYGDDPAQWAKGAYEMEQHITRIAREKKEAEDMAVQWFEYAQEVEQQKTQEASMAMPLSTQEEQWIDNAMANPYAYAWQAASQGNVNLYKGIIARVAEDNPLMAGEIGTRVQMELAQLAASTQPEEQPVSLQESLGQSIARLGIDLPTYGEPMSAKIGELGEFHPYVQAILEGDQKTSDLALMAVYDLVRTGAMSTRRVRSEEREAQIQKEAEMRRQAAGVVTGGPSAPEPPAESSFMDAMQREWEARGQWPSEE
jgi:hypothetical protein